MCEQCLKGKFNQVKKTKHFFMETKTFLIHPLLNLPINKRAVAGVQISFQSYQVTIIKLFYNAMLALLYRKNCSE